MRRLPGSYAHLVDGEAAPLEAGQDVPEIVTFDRISEAHPANLVSTLGAHRVAHHEGESAQEAAASLAARSAAQMTSLALTAGHASLEAHLAGTAVDAGGLIPDIQVNNSWTQVVDEVDPLELLEVQLCNSTAPFLLVSRLRSSMRAAVAGGARRAYVVNVSAMEGQFSRRYKGAGHPHTNMAKAALNMHRLDHRRTPAPRETPHRGRGVARAAGPRRRRRPRLRPDRARRGRRRPVRHLPQGLRTAPVVTRVTMTNAATLATAMTRPRASHNAAEDHANAPGS